MKSSLTVRLVAALTVSLASFFPAVSPAQNITPPVVLNRIPRVVVPVGTVRSTIPLDNVFGLTGVGDQVVRFSTSLGNVDVVMISTVAPGNVSNFLEYVDFGSYTNSFLHRSVQDPGLAILQGGGFYVDADQITAVETGPPVANEFGVSNARGTLAMAKTSDPDSATSQFFFNVQDNSVALDDPQNSGGFTVFGAVIGDGLVVVDALAALRTFNAGQPFTDLPVLDSYVGGNIELSDLVYINGVTRIPLLPSVAGETALLTVKVVANTNPGLVTGRIIANKLRLNYVAGATGLATLTLRATDTAGSIVRTKVTVRVH